MRSRLGQVISFHMTPRIVLIGIRCMKKFAVAIVLLTGIAVGVMGAQTGVGTPFRIENWIQHSTKLSRPTPGSKRWATVSRGPKGQ